MNLIDNAWDALSAASPEAMRLALEALFGKASFRLIDDSGVGPSSARDEDVVDAVRRLVAKQLLSAIQ